MDAEQILYSRQLSIADNVSGLHKIKSSKILLFQANTLVLEVCRNLCLTGVSDITIMDDAIVTDNDSSCWV